MEAETCKKELVIEIPVDVVRREAESVTSQYKRFVRIPGFRPGHAPPSLVRRHFREEIRKEVVQSLLPKFFEDAVKDQKWSLATQPHFEDLKFEDDQPLTCKATFEVYPEFELKGYTDLEVEQEAATVSEADIDHALEQLRERAATFEVVQDRPASEGDYVTVSYQGHNLEDPANNPVESPEAVVHVGGEKTVAGFTENLRGSKPGEVREFEVAYPADYPQKSLAAKTYRYRVEVQSIKKKVLPVLDDELAKSVSEQNTLEELRKKVRADLEVRREHQVEVQTKRRLVEHLLKAHEFPVPEALVEERLDGKLEAILSQLMMQGVDPRTTQIDWRKVRTESRPEAEKEVRGSLILEKVAAAEDIQVSEEEVDEIVREMAQTRHEAAAALKTRLTRDGGLGRIKSTRRSQKALDFVYHKAKIIQKSE